jgi:alpha-L-rhamnosidase
VLEICGLGYYEAWINGRRVGDHLLDPAQTDYEQRVFFVEYDVTSHLWSGENVLGVMLGNGWYNQDRVWQPGVTPYGDVLPYGSPRLLAELKLTYTDGRIEKIGSDTLWKTAAGPVLENNIYAGEVYDARCEIPGWNAPGFDASGWEAAVEVAPPGGELIEQPLPPIREIETLAPVAVSRKEPGRFVVDFGQNFAGWVRIQIDAPAGSEIVLKFAETVFENGEVDTASTGVFATRVEQVDRYICRGGGEIWEPRFTYHGFRYVDVSGWPGELSADQLCGVVVHTDLPILGTFECSDERLNRIHRMALWTHRSNIHGLPEDCPARERCGWLGDANVAGEFSMWNFDGKAFWEKYLGDIETSRALHGGIPCNIAPGRRTCGQAKPDWAAAFIMLPWYVYLFSGDASVLSKHWEGMQVLIEHFNDSADGWLLPGGWGDWYDPGDDGPCSHTPPLFTTTVWFLACARVMCDTARLLEKPAETARYNGWTAAIEQALVERFYSNGSFGSQTANVMALQFGFAPDEAAVLDHLVCDIHERDDHLNVGIMGLRYLFEVLSKYGHGDLALKILHQDTYPGFGYQIGLGATTLWECWGEPELSRKQGPRSLSHPMMSGFDNWFFNTLGGIRPDPARPGFRHFFLEPRPCVEKVCVHHDSPHGRIRSDWTFRRGEFHWTVEVPPGTTASAVLPFSGASQTLAPGTHHLTDSVR